MTVYVDNMNASYGRMKMCHMLADTDDELLAMAEKIGVQGRWHQYPGTIKSHFDICLSKRAKAVAYGAVEIDYPSGVALIMKQRREQLAGLQSHAPRVLDPEVGREAVSP